jgi:hypothetical protein
VSSVRAEMFRRPAETSDDFNHILCLRRDVPCGSFIRSDGTRVAPACVIAGSRTAGILCPRRDIPGLPMPLPRPSKKAYPLHPQRCSVAEVIDDVLLAVSSARAEMFRCGTIWMPCRKRILCACRDVPPSNTLRSAPVRFSLHTQRCPPAHDKHVAVTDFPSAYAEIFPSARSRRSPFRRLLCAHRDVPPDFLFAYRLKAAPTEGSSSASPPYENPS